MQVSNNEFVRLALRPLMKTFDPRGRARRSEAVAYQLMLAVIALAFGVLFSILPLALPSPVFVFAVSWILFIPMITLMSRRLHDIGLSGWLVLAVLPCAAINLRKEYCFKFGLDEQILAGTCSLSTFEFTLQILGALAGLTLLIAPGTDGPNRFGPDPRMPVEA